MSLASHRKRYVRHLAVGSYAEAHINAQPLAIGNGKLRTHACTTQPTARHDFLFTLRLAQSRTSLTEQSKLLLISLVCQDPSQNFSTIMLLGRTHALPGSCQSRSIGRHLRVNLLQLCASARSHTAGNSQGLCYNETSCPASFVGPVKLDLIAGMSRAGVSHHNLKPRFENKIF